MAKGHYVTISQERYSSGTMGTFLGVHLLNGIICATGDIETAATVGLVTNVLFAIFAVFATMVTIPKQESAKILTQQNMMVSK